MQTAVSNPCAAPQRDIDTIVLEARHLLGTSKPLEPGKRPTYPRDAVTIGKVLALRDESGLPIDRFCDRVRVSQATFFCWQNGQTGGGKDWPDLFRLLQERKAAAIGATLGSLGGRVDPNATFRPPVTSWEIPTRSPVTGLVGDAAKRLEALRQSPPQVAPAKVEAMGVAFPTPQVAPKIVRPTAEDLLAQAQTVSVTHHNHTAAARQPGAVLKQAWQPPVGPVEWTQGVAVVVDPEPRPMVHMVDYSGVEIGVMAQVTRDLEQAAANRERIKGSELIAARDEAYARFQAAIERMPAAGAAADLVSIYRRSHRGLPGFCKGHYDAKMMAKRVEQWTAGRDEEGEQWDRLIALLDKRGIKPSINGLGKRAAKATRVVKPANDAPEMVLIRPARGFLDLKGGFHVTEVEALTSSWNILVQDAATEVLTQAARANVTLGSFLVSDEAVKPCDDLARALKGREAHQRAVKGGQVT